MLGPRIKNLNPQQLLAFYQECAEVQAYGTFTQYLENEFAPFLIQGFTKSEVWRMAASDNKRADRKGWGKEHSMLRLMRGQIDFTKVPGKYRKYGKIDYCLIQVANRLWYCFNNLDMDFLRFKVQKALMVVYFEYLKGQGDAEQAAVIIQGIMDVSEKFCWKVLQQTIERRREYYKRRPPAAGDKTREVLYFIGNREEATKLKDICDHFQLKLSTVRNRMETLMELGWIERSGHGLYLITEEGKSYL